MENYILSTYGLRVEPEGSVLTPGDWSGLRDLIISSVTRSRVGCVPNADSVT